MKRQADAMICHAVLREIVGANFLFTSTSADLPAALSAIFFRFLALLSFQQPCAQDRKRSFLVFDLAATVLTTHDCACGNVQHLDRQSARLQFANLPASIQDRRLPPRATPRPWPSMYECDPAPRSQARVALDELRFRSGAYEKQIRPKRGRSLP